MRRRILASAAFVVLAALAGQALTLLRLSEADIVRQSDRIVLGTVIGTRAEWADPDGDGHQNIYTITTFRIEQTLKGQDQPGTQLTLRMFGGTIGDHTQGVGGLTPFSTDERLILCLEANPQNALGSPIVGVTQGRWIVRTDGNGGEFARREFADASFMVRDTGGTLTPADPPSGKEEPLSDVLARLQTLVQAEERK